MGDGPMGFAVDMAHRSESTPAALSQWVSSCVWQVGVELNLAGVGFLGFAQRVASQVRI